MTSAIPTLRGCSYKNGVHYKFCGGLAPIIVQDIVEFIAQLHRDQPVSFLISGQNINVALKQVFHSDK